MKPKFQPGEAVTLNVGGPKLYVEENIRNEDGTFTGLVKCCWIDDEKRHSENFDQEFLVQNVLRLI